MFRLGFQNRDHATDNFKFFYNWLFIHQTGLLKDIDRNLKLANYYLNFIAFDVWLSKLHKLNRKLPGNLGFLDMSLSVCYFIVHKLCLCINHKLRSTSKILLTYKQNVTSINIKDQRSQIIKINLHKSASHQIPNKI